MAQPSISVIVASFNASATLQRCIDSVIGQSYPHRELVIIDGGSSDGTVELLKSNSDRLAYWKSEPDKGIYHAWNKALDHARGDWICFLGADDYLWSPDALERLAPSLERAYPAHRVVYAKVAVVSSDGNLMEQVGQPWERARRLIRHELSIPHQGVLQHSRLFRDHGKFDESFRITGDYDFLLRELKDRPALFVPDLTLTGMQIGGVSSLLSNTLLNISELRRARRNNGLPDFSLPLTWREIRAKTRQRIQKAIGKKAADLIADTYRVATGKPRIWTRPR